MKAIVISEHGTKKGNFRTSILVVGPTCTRTMVKNLINLIQLGASEETEAENKTVRVMTIGRATRISAPSTWLQHLAITPDNPLPRMEQIIDLISEE